MNPCPICNNSFSDLKYKLAFDIYQCNNCGFQFCPDATFDISFSSNLDEGSKAKALKKLRRENFQKIIKSIRQYAINKPKGLEVGPGNGWFLEICNYNSIECEGIEPEIRFNEEYKNQNLIVTNGFYPEDITYQNKYDFIIFNDVFEHLPNLDKIMKANSLLLNSGGLLIINLPIQEGLIYFFAKMTYHFRIKSILNRMWQFNFHSPHLSYFAKRNLIDFASINNFQLKKSYKLKTINFSEISDRIKQDKSQGALANIVTKIGVLFLYPFLQIFPDTFCFVFKKHDE